MTLRYHFLLPKLLGAAVAGSLLSGCSVYIPTMPSTPILRKRQVQVSAGLRGFTTLEAGAAWAPTNHLLLSAESSLYTAKVSTTDHNNQTIEYHDYHRQASLGVGYYRAAPSGWYLAALGGVGVARSAQHDIGVGVAFIFPVPVIDGYDEATYLRYYAQAYVAQRASRNLTTGFSFRTVYVDYTHLSRDSQPFSSNTHVFFEPMFFLKAGHGPLQFQGNLGLSVPLHTNADAPTGNATSPNSSLIGVALIFRPDLLKKGRYPDSD